MRVSLRIVDRWRLSGFLVMIFIVRVPLIPSSLVRVSRGILNSLKGRFGGKIWASRSRSISGVQCLCVKLIFSPYVGSHLLNSAPCFHLFRQVYLRRTGDSLFKGMSWSSLLLLLQHMYNRVFIYSIYIKNMYDYSPLCMTLCSRLFIFIFSKSFI